MEATGRLAFTDQTACRTWLRKPSVPVRSLRMAKVAVRMASKGEGPYILGIRVGQYTVSGAFLSTPFSWTSSTTPITSFHGIVGYSRRRLPSAAVGEPHISRAKFA